VRWYLRFKLSYRDLVEMMAERDLSLAHTTIMRRVHHYAPEFERRWNRFARPAGFSWRVDETYVKIRGKWVYLYRAVDSAGRTVDFRLSGKRDVVAAKAFFRKAMKSQGSTPRTITLDGYAASHRAVREMKTDGQLPADTKVRSSKYLNNLIEQDHRGVKLRIAPMRGFKWLRTAAIVIAGIELLRRRPCCSEDSRVEGWYTPDSCSHGPDIVRASEPQHLVQDPGGDGDLGRLGLLSPRP
jgi:transposase-like protein